MRIPVADHVQRAGARLLARLPVAVQLALAGGGRVGVDGQVLEPQVQLIRAVRRLRSRHGLCEPSVPEARARYRRETVGFNWPPTPVGAVRDLDLGGGLIARHYAPPDGEGRPLTVYLHGGGFTLGDLETHDQPCRLLCRHAATHVLAVDYRRAPEHPFPAALEDAHAALAWAQAHAPSLGADPRRVAIGGDSAGGNLAAVVAQATRAARPPAAQLLLYPPVDSVTPRRSHELFDRGFFLSRADRAAFDRNYLDGTGVALDDPRVSPLRGELAALAPALVVSTGFDILRDEADAYAAALQAAGTVVRLLRIPGHGHGFIHMAGISPAAHGAVLQVARAWRELLDGLQTG